MTSTVSACVSCPGFTSTGSARKRERPRLLSSAAAAAACCCGLKGLDRRPLKQKRTSVSICWERTSFPSTAVVLETVCVRLRRCQDVHGCCAAFRRFTLFIQADTSPEARRRLPEFVCFCYPAGKQLLWKPLFQSIQFERGFRVIVWFVHLRVFNLDEHREEKQRKSSP